MRMASTFITAAVVASASLLAAPAGAAPLSGSLALKSSTAAPVETVQWRGHRGGNWRGGNWIGPAAGFAAGAVIGSALAAPYYGGGNGYYGDSYAYAPGYDSYANAPGYSYAPGYESYGYADEGRSYIPRGNTSNTGRNPTRRFADPAKGENN